METDADVEFHGFVPAPGPVRRAVYHVATPDGSFTVTVDLPASMAGSLEAATRADGEDRDHFHARAEMALADYGRDYARTVAADAELRAAATASGGWDHSVAGHELHRLRRLLRESA